MLISPLSRLSPLGESLGSYWTQQLIDASCLFFASDNTDILNKVAATHLPNQVTGAVDFLTVTGTGLNARYRTPDNNTYRTADSDYVFWKSDASESTCDGNRLIAWDFPRILVKYLNVSPYTITAIAILKPGVTVTDGMRTAFQLSIWWDGTGSLHGFAKGNRSEEQSVWIQEPVYDAASVALFARMTVAGETQTNARKTNYDTAIKALKTANLFNTRFIAFGITRAKGLVSTKMNWIQDAFNLTEDLNGGTLTYTEDIGYNNDGTKSSLSTNFTPSTDGGTLFTQNNASFGFKINGSPGSGARAVGAYCPGYGAVLFYNNGATPGHCMNETVAAAGSDVVMASGYNAIVRNSATAKKQYINSAEHDNNSSNSSGLANEPLHLLSAIQGGTRWGFLDSGCKLEMWFIGAYPSPAEFITMQTIVDNFITGL